MNHRILCFGEILFDVFPEYKQLGGAPFNFAYHLVQFGPQVAFVSRIGQDANGEEILSFLKERDFPTHYMQIDAEYPTGIVQVTLDDQRKPDFEITEGVAYDFIRMEDELSQFDLHSVDLLYFGTLCQRHAVSRQTIQHVLATRPESVRVLYDMNLRQSFYTQEILRQSLLQADIVKLNDDEFACISMLFGLANQEDEAARQLMDTFSLTHLCITKGAQGSTLWEHSQKFDWQNPDDGSLQVIDTVGAGDSFAAVLAYGILEHWPGERIIRQASQFAAAVCTIPGAIPDEETFYRRHAPFIK